MDERTHPTQPDRRHWLARASAAVGWAWCGAGLAPSAQAARSSTTPLLAREWTPGDDPRDWLVSEKLDGVRALWDGHQLRFRSGRLVQAPAEFLACLPAEPLDGELWLGRGRFDELSGVVRRRGADAANWRAVQYHVFELPAGAGSFAQRAQRLQAAQRMARHLGHPPGKLGSGQGHQGLRQRRRRGRRRTHRIRVTEPSNQPRARASPRRARGPGYPARRSRRNSTTRSRAR